MASLRKFGQEGTNTAPSPAGNAHLLQRVTLGDGFLMLTKDNMYRGVETQIGRRECHFPGLHNLSDAVIARTVHPPPVGNDPNQSRRAEIWDAAAQATREALANIPTGSHINICANSGPKNVEFEKMSPADKVKGADVGLLYVAEFRDDIHPGWIQVACPINAHEGRLLAGVRVLALVTGRADLTFHITNLTNHNVSDEWFWAIRDYGLDYGAVVQAYRPTNLGCTYFRGLHFAADAEAFRGSFAWDGDLYGWDEAMLYTRQPTVIITDDYPERRFQHWMPETVYHNVEWFRVVDGKLVGGRHRTTTREKLVEWEKQGMIASAE